MTEVRFCDRSEADDAAMGFAVVAARYKDKWIFCRHRARDTWELPGGHREPEEDLDRTAARELREETGAQEFSLEPVCAYILRGQLNGSGMLYFAEVRSLGQLPPMEIAETSCFDFAPDSWTYPDVQPVLFRRVQEWLCIKMGEDELWDVYDSGRNLTGRTIRRGEALKAGEYHLCVHAWITAPDDRFLITQRSPGRGYAGMWECSGGSALAGEGSLAAALREIVEETGLLPSADSGRLLRTIRRQHDFCDIWLFCHDFTLEDVVLQQDETCCARLVSFDELLAMKANGTLVPFDYLEQLPEWISDPGGVNH